MAALGSQSIASSYEQLLHVDANGGGDGTTHVSVKDGDNGTTFGFTIASDALMMSSTNRLEFGDDGTYIHQSADGVLDLVSDTEIELTATTIDMNGALDLDGTLTQDAGAVIFNEAGADYDFRVESSGNANMLFVDGGDDLVGIGTASPASPLEIEGTAIVDGASTVLKLYNSAGANTGLQLVDNAGKAMLQTNSGVLGFYTDSQTEGNNWSAGDEAMRIDTSGNVNIPGLDASSDVQTDASKNLTTSSDSRLKNDLGEIADGLSVIQNLTPRYFSWKDDENSTKQLGFFAQEVFEHLPESAPREEKMNLISPETESQEAVYERALDENGDPDWNWGFNGRPIIAMLVKAVQELSAKVEALEG